MKLSPASQTHFSLTTNKKSGKCILLQVQHFKSETPCINTIIFVHLIIPDFKKNLKDKASILFQFPYIHESFSHGYERKIVPPWTLFPKCGLIPTFLFAVIIFCCWCWAFVWFRLNKYLRKVSLVEHHQNKTNVFCSGFMFEKRMRYI